MQYEQPVTSHPFCCDITASYSCRCDITDTMDCTPKLQAEINPPSLLHFPWLYKEHSLTAQPLSPSEEFGKGCWVRCQVTLYSEVLRGIGEKVTTEASARRAFPGDIKTDQRGDREESGKFLFLVWSKCLSIPIHFILCNDMHRVKDGIPFKSRFCYCPEANARESKF